jgi:DNA-binding response OmpR family regulator
MSAFDVVYIEDDEMAAELFTIGLSKKGLSVLHIPDVRLDDFDSLLSAEFVNAKAVFIDYMIGTTNGVEVARILREMGDVRPLFLLTAGNNPDPRLLRQLNVYYLAKPVNYNQLAVELAAL